MNERLIRTSVLCERLGMGKSTAVAIMAENGVFPICLGSGRGRGTFWLSSAVDAAIKQMHENAQNVVSRNIHTRNEVTRSSLADMCIDDLLALTREGTASTKSSDTFGHK